MSCLANQNFCKKPWIHLPTFVFILFNLAPYGFLLCHLYIIQANKVSFIIFAFMFPSSTEDHINIQYFVLNGKIFSISDAFWEKECLFKSISTTCDPFLWLVFNYVKTTEPLREGSSLFTTKFTEIPSTHMVNLGKMKGWVELRATQ